MYIKYDVYNIYYIYLLMLTNFRFFDKEVWSFYATLNVLIPLSYLKYVI